MLKTNLMLMRALVPISFTLSAVYDYHRLPRSERKLNPEGVLKIEYYYRNKEELEQKIKKLSLDGIDKLKIVTGMKFQNFK